MASKIPDYGRERVIIAQSSKQIRTASHLSDMSLAHHLLIALLLLGAGVSIWLAAVAWRRHPERWALPFTILTLALAYWSLGAAVELSVPRLEDKIFSLNLQYVAIAPVPLILWWFAVAYTNRTHWLRWYVVLPAALIPLTTMILVWNVWEGAWREDAVLDTTITGISWINPTEGFWFPVQIGFAYLCIATMLVLLSYEAWRTNGMRRRQAMVLIAAVFIPMSGNILTITGIVGLDITPLFFSLSGIVMAWGLVRYRLFDVGLTARQLLINSMADGMIAINRHNIVVDVNEAVVKLLQLPRKDILGKPLRAVLAEQISKEQYEAFRRAGQGELHLHTAAGSFWYDMRLSLIGQTASAVATPATAQGTLILLRDITQRKQEAQAVEELRETLTRAMVHDLRSPISVAYTAAGFLKEVLDEELSAEDHHLLTGMEQNLTHAMRLINEILDLSRLESGRMALDKRPFAVTTWLTAVMGQQQVAAEAKGIVLEVNAPPQLPAAEGDYHLLERVLQNLVGNGIKFAPQGGKVAITVEPNQTHFLLTVADSGEGVPASIRPYLFQKFVKGNQEQAGSGLGLAFCKMVLEAHEQRIWLMESAKGGETGATFCFTLPIDGHVF